MLMHSYHIQVLHITANDIVAVAVMHVILQKPLSPNVHFVIQNLMEGLQHTSKRELILININLILTHSKNKKEN